MTTGTVSPVVRSLRGIAPLIGDLVGQVGGLRSRPDTGGRTGKADEAPLPMNATAFDDANALFLHLANEVIYEAAWLEQPAPVIDAWRTENGTIVGLRSGTTALQAFEQANDLAEWLLDRLDRLPEHALDALLTEVRSIAARHPYRDRPRTSTTAVCPTCAGALTVHPPRHLGDQLRATCRACATDLDEQEYADTETRYAAVVAREKVRTRAMGVAARLAAKYGRVTS